MLRLTAFILNIPKRMLRGGAHDESANENGSDRIKISALTDSVAFACCAVH